MTSLLEVELGVLGPLQVRRAGAPVAIPGAKPRAILTMLGLHVGSVVSADTLVELLWGEDPPRTAGKALQTHISSLRRALGDGFVLTEGAGWTLAESEVDASRYKSAARRGREAAAAGDTGQAVARFEEALELWRGIPELPDGRRGTSEKTRWIEGHAALVEDRADALLATGRAAEIIGELEAAVADAPLRERRWAQLMLALYRAGRQGEALGAYQRARTLLADELGVDPGPELRRLEAAIVAQDAALETPGAQNVPAVTRAVTFLLTDIEGSTAAWEADAVAMGAALARHDELVEQVVTSRGGRLIKTRGEGDATFSVFERPSAGAAAALELQDAIVGEPWALREPMRVRVALHTGEAEFRDGDYFGRAVNRAARLRSLAAGGQILCSGATAELVIDSLPDDVVLADLGTRQLRNLARPEHVFELRRETAEVRNEEEVSAEAPLERPSLPAVLAGPGPFVGRGQELERLFSAWQTALAGGTNAVLIAGEPGVGKTRLSGEWSRQAYDQGALVIYGRCDEDLGAPYQPFAEALRSLVPCLGSERLGGLRGVEALLPLVPGLTDVLPDLAAPTRADPDTERYALFDAVVALLGVASASAPVVLILDDLHWAAKPTLLLLRHLLRFGERARVQIIGTYRSTDLDRSHPLSAMLADLHRDGTANRLQLGGLDEDDVSAYVAEAGYNDEELARALASVTGGNPFFLIEALRHVEESGGRWDQSTLPQGVREAVSRRLSRLTPETNKALAAAAVVGSRFALELVERVVGDDLVDAFDEAGKAGIVIEEPGGRYRFNHALVRQSLLAELPSVRRMRLHQRIATTLENEPGADDELLAELAHHYFECAWAGNAVKAVEYCRRAADQAMARLAYEGAADLYDRALHALEEIDDELPDRDDQTAELLVARCEALLAAGDVTSAAGAVSQLQSATVDSTRLAAWATCFDGQLSMLIDPERLDEIEAAVATAAAKLAELGDAAGEATAHTVRAGCLARLGRIGDCEVALDDALTAARRAREHRRVNAVLANAPLAALWGPNPVPRAGGRCLDVVRLLRITTESPAVEATSTRCQAVLEAFRGRAAAARRMIDSARRTVTELGLRHALLEVEQFAGIVELVVDEPAAAEPHLRRAYNGFRRMGLDADTAETAALLGRTCLLLDRDAEADELCSESERLAGHALKASIAWRTLRAQLLSRGSDHDEARRVAEAAVALAERTDALVDHGDACLSLATVLGAAGDVPGARGAAERAVGLYERKGAAALAEKGRRILGAADLPQPQPKAAPIEPTNACVQAGGRLIDAVNREAWDDVAQLLAPYVSVESRRKIVGFPRMDVPSSQWPQDMRRYLETGMVRYRHAALAVRGERLALMRLEMGTTDLSSGAPKDEMLQVVGLDEEGRIALQVKFDVEDMDAAIAELDAVHARLEEEHPPARRLENAACQTFLRMQACFAARDWDALAGILDDNLHNEDRRRVVNAGVHRGRDATIEGMRWAAANGITHATSNVIATRGNRLVLARARFSQGDEEPEAFNVDALQIAEIGADERIVAIVMFDTEDFESAIAELDRRYQAGEAAAHARTWLVVTGALLAHNRRELPAATPDAATIDHRRVAAFAPGEGIEYLRAGWDLGQKLDIYIEAVHRLSDLGAVFTWAGYGSSDEGFEAEWRGINLMTVDGEMVDRSEVFDEADVEAAVARFDQLSRPAPRLENAASRVLERYFACFAARDWDVMAETLTDDFLTNDRRRVVNAGVRRGRDAEIANMQSFAGIGIINIVPTTLATRGERLVLCRHYVSLHDWAEPSSDVIGVVEITGAQISAHVMFDADDIDAAIEELDTRYLAGEASANCQTWSVIAAAYAALNRQQFPATTADLVNIDHRGETAFGPAELSAYLRAGLDLDQGITIYIESVHRLTDIGAVIGYAAHETSREGLQAEWRGVALLTVEGDMINRCEVFREADVDAAIARFENLSRPAPRLGNAASQALEQWLAHFATRDWDAMAALVADDYYGDDRRPVFGAGIQRGGDVMIRQFQTAADLDVTRAASDVVATRGNRVALTHTLFSRIDDGPDAFRVDVLYVVEIDADERISALVAFDASQFEAAIQELDARYLAGEAAAYVRTWSTITGVYAALNRREIAATTADFVSVDHRRGPKFAPGDLIAYVRASWDLAHDGRTHIEAVHRLNNLGVVVTHVVHGTSQEGFEAEWREVVLLAVEGDLISRSEMFDESDLATAITRFEELHPSTPRLENTATRVFERAHADIAARDWDAVGQTAAENVSVDDRRRVVNAGVGLGRDDAIEATQPTVDIGFTMTLVGVLATRGDRVALTRVRVSGRDPEAVQNDALSIVEIDTDDRIVAIVVFDLDATDAAFAELDARYLTGEAVAHARSWSVIAGVFVAHNRRELPATTPDAVSIDHRCGAAFAPGEGFEYIRAGWNLDQNLNIYIETAHRLNDLGAVFTWTGHGTSREGFDAEWRGVTLMTVDGEMLSRIEVFDEADLDSALARFDQLNRPAPQLENEASRAYERFRTYFAARDWAAMAELLTADTSVDDHRRVVNAETRRGRDVEIANMRAFADIGVTTSTATVIATRGERLALCRTCISSEDHQIGGFRIEMLIIVETSVDKKILARVAYDPEDIEAAFAELDARYLTGEAAAHARTWSVLLQAYAALNRHEMPSTTPDWVNVDHRRGASFASGEMPALLDAAWSLTTDLRHSIEAVHRLNDLGAVVTNTSHETSHDGFDAEWRVITIGTVEGDMLSRTEVFDEADLDVALARFDELTQQAPRLENVATQVWERLYSYILAGDWHAVAQISAENVSVDDRRRVVNAGILHGRDANIKDAQATVDVGFTMTMVGVLAIRGTRLALTRVRVSGREPEAIQNDALSIVEIDADERIVGVVVFDLDDTDAAFAELDARYLAGEAAAHAHTWSVISAVYAALNRREMPAVAPDLVDVDHRALSAIGSGDFMAYLRASLEDTEDTPRNRIYIEAVHQLTDLGAVTTHVAKSTSREGFEAEWRITSFFIVGGDAINRYEIYDDADIDAAIARFEQLSRPVPRLENAATRVNEHIWACFAARDWDRMNALFADDMRHDDRRRMVGAGVLHGRDAQMRDMRVYADIGINPTIDVIATRGERLALTRARFSGLDHEPQDFIAEALIIVEIDADEKMAAIVALDPDDIDAAFEELDARYLAGEAGLHARTWSAIARECAAFNRHELPAAEWVTIDHRQLAVIDAREGQAAMGAIWDVTPDLSMRIEAVHRLSSFGVVANYAASGTSPEGLDVEWPMILLLTLEGDRINRCEIFDETDIDAALERLEQLRPQAPRLENTASQMAEQFLAHFAAHDWDAMADLLTDDVSSDDRRRTVNAGIRRGRDAEMANWRATADIWTTRVESTVIATRGERLALIKVPFTSQDRSSDAFDAAAFAILEINDDNRIAADVVFDLDDFDAAITELDARYLAGEAAGHRHTWPVIARICAAFNRKELFATTPDPIYIDHRPLVSVEGADLAASIRAVWDLTSKASVYIEAVHQLSERGAVFTEVLDMTSREGFDAEVRMIMLFTVEGDLISGVEVFDEADIDAALARFDELQPQARRLANAASHVDQRFWALFASREWDAMAELLAADVSTDDRRRVVNAVVLHGRNVHIESMQTLAKLGAKVTSEIVAIRGEHLALTHLNRQLRPGQWGSELLYLIQIGTNHRLAAGVFFDPDDIDAAFEELENRYLAGEAADQAPTWSAVRAVYSALNRHEHPALTRDSVCIDRRPLVPIETADLATWIREVWDLTPDLSNYVENVHRLSNYGAVLTHAARGTSQAGFSAEWRLIAVLLFEGDQIARLEIFDEAEIDAALARFDELQPRAQRLENAAGRIVERFEACFSIQDWVAIAELLADDMVADDRRRVVNAGLRHGRDLYVADLRAAVDVGAETITTRVIATRSERLVLTHVRAVNRGFSPDEVGAEWLCIVEIGADERIVAMVVFDPDDIDAAYAEFDARYLAGEAAAHAHTWSLVTRAYAALNRRQLPEAAADWVNIDHRRLAPIPAGGLSAYLLATWDLSPQSGIRIEAVHRLSKVGAVVTQVVKGTSHQGFEAEWRTIDLSTYDGDKIKRTELFDEDDLDAALARFDELNRPPPLENKATRTWSRMADATNHRDMEGFLALSAADLRYEDRRKGLRGEFEGPERRKAVQTMFESLPISVRVTADPIAIRGSRLSLVHIRYRDTDYADRPITVEFLQVAEVDDRGLMLDCVSFDLDDADAAFEELDARYLAGEAATYAQSWSVAVQAYAAANRHELPKMAPDPAFVDHRPLVTTEAEDLAAYIPAMWDLMSDVSVHIEAVHRLSEFGGVITHAARGTSHEGLDAEWRTINVFTIEGDLLNRVEVYDQADLDAALARFDELNRPG